MSAFSRWQRQVAAICGSVAVKRLTSHDDFDGTITCARFGGIRAISVRADPHRVVRRSGLAGDDRGIYICLIHAGRMQVEQDGRRAWASAGHLVSFDSARGYRLSMPERFSMVGMIAPHRLLGVQPAASGHFTARTWVGDEGTAALLSTVLSSVGQHMETVPAGTASLLGEGIGSFASSMLLDALRRDAGQVESARQSLYLRIQAAARRSLTDPDLSPARLAAEHNISLRYLYSLFNEQGLRPAEWIRHQRLERCRKDLEDPGLSHLTVAQVGERYGLPGASHFCRIFRAQYGLTPQEYRRRTVLAAPVPPAAAVPA